MIVALFGAAGRTGRRVMERLLARGDHVRALVRDPARLPAHPSLAVRAGDALDPAAVAATLSGADAVAITLGMHDIARPSTGFSDAVLTVVEAAHAAGVRRLVAIASAAALPDPRGGLRADHAPGGPYANVNAEHARNYRALAASGLDWTLLCPVELVEDIPEGHAEVAYETLPAGSHQTGYEDLAATVVAVLGDRAAHGRRIGIVSLR